MRGLYEGHEASPRIVSKTRVFKATRPATFPRVAIKLLQALGFGHVQAAEPGLPVVEGRLGDTVLAGEAGGLRTGLLLAHNRDDMICSSVNRARFICPSLRRPDSKSPWNKNAVTGQGRRLLPSAAPRYSPMQGASAVAQAMIQNSFIDVIILESVLAAL